MVAPHALALLIYILFQMIFALFNNWLCFWLKQDNCVYETVVLPLDERAFEKTLTPIIQEYFEHGDTNEVAVCLMIFWHGLIELQNPLLGRFQRGSRVHLFQHVQ